MVAAERVFIIRTDQGTQATRPASDDVVLTTRTFSRIFSYSFSFLAYTAVSVLAGGPPSRRGRKSARSLNGQLSLALSLPLFPFGLCSYSPFPPLPLGSFTVPWLYPLPFAQPRSPCFPCALYRSSSCSSSPRFPPYQGLVSAVDPTDSSSPFGYVQWSFPSAY